MKNKWVKLYLLSCIVLMPFFTMSQEYDGLTSNNKRISIPFEDSTLIVELQSFLQEGFEVKDELTYYWYYKGIINQTKGGFDGQLLNGDYIVKWKNGNLKTKGSFNYGLFNGIWKNWDKNGQILELQEWGNGVKEGVMKRWSNEGLLIVEIGYINGIEDGEYAKYHKNGQLAEKGKIKKGYLDGEVQTFYNDGDLESEVNYKRGVRHGKAILFGIDGKEIYNRTYINGEIKLEKQKTKIEEKE